MRIQIVVTAGLLAAVRRGQPGVCATANQSVALTRLNVALSEHQLEPSTPKLRPSSRTELREMCNQMWFVTPLELTWLTSRSS
jgi:hypothetical protein